MRKLSAYLLLFFMSIILTACSTVNPFEQPPTTTTSTTTTVMQGAPHVPESQLSNAPVGGSIQNSMDENDKTKLWHALDNAVGKPTHWINANTNIDYTVVPIRKVSINGNPFCRKYTVTAVKNDKKNEFDGTACVGDDSNWKAVKE